MILGILYTFVHLLLGVLAAVWTDWRLKKAGYDDGCARFAADVVAFIFWPLALAVLIVVAAFDFVTGDD